MLIVQARNGLTSSNLAIQGLNSLSLNCGTFIFWKKEENINVNFICISDPWTSRKVSYSKIIETFIIIIIIIIIINLI